MCLTCTYLDDMSFEVVLLTILNFGPSIFAVFPPILNDLGLASHELLLFSTNVDLSACTFLLFFLLTVIFLCLTWNIISSGFGRQLLLCGGCSNWHHKTRKNEHVWHSLDRLGSSQGRHPSETSKHRSFPIHLCLSHNLACCCMCFRFCQVRHKEGHESSSS